MALPPNPTRRAMVTALTMLPLSNHVAFARTDVEATRNGSKTLVAYFSRSGNTRVVAGLIHRGVKADLFEIRPASAYPEDYMATVEQARLERDSGVEPALEGTVPSMDTYHTVYLGFPIWGETAPPVIRSFLKAHDLVGKTLIPFVTHGGYGLGNSSSVLASHAPKTHMRPGFSMQADQDRQTMDRVKGWLGEFTPNG